MKDIKTTEDVKLLVDSFYTQIQSDDLIGAIFLQAIGTHWEEHLSKMYRFWSSILFSDATYKGNPMLIHIELDKQIPLEEAHFARWVQLWEQTIDTHFVGENAQNAKKRATMIKNLMHYKVQASRTNEFIQ